MTTAEKLNALHLDWANGKITLAQILWEAYAYGFSDGADGDAWVEVERPRG